LPSQAAQAAARVLLDKYGIRHLDQEPDPERPPKESPTAESRVYLIYNRQWIKYPHAAFAPLSIVASGLLSILTGL
jgi:hypothetical protein